MVKKLTILAAVEREFALLGERRREFEERWNCILNFATVGIGIINAAAGTEKAASAFPDSEFLLLGSCGRYGDRLPLLRPVTPVSHKFGTTQLAVNKSYVPAGLFPTLEIPPFPDLPSCSCLTTPAITADTEESLKLSSYYGADAEHLESYAVIKTLTDKKLPVREVLVPVNDTGPGAHEQYLRNLDAGLQRLSKTISELEKYPWLKEK
jgi:hypothetical protein